MAILLNIWLTLLFAARIFVRESVFAPERWVQFFWFNSDTHHEQSFGQIRTTDDERSNVTMMWTVLQYLNWVFLPRDLNALVFAERWVQFSGLHHPIQSMRERRLLLKSRTDRWERSLPRESDVNLLQNIWLSFLPRDLISHRESSMLRERPRVSQTVFFAQWIAKSFEWGNFSNQNEQTEKRRMQMMLTRGILNIWDNIKPYFLYREIPSTLGFCWIGEFSFNLLSDTLHESLSQIRTNRWEHARIKWCSNLQEY